MGLLPEELSLKMNRPESRGIVETLTDGLSGSELNTLLLHVFKERAGKLSPAALLKNYESNRFVHPAGADPIALKRLELTLLELAAEHGSVPIQLSPVAPLGCSSAMATVDQHKVISALRGTEVVSDATNLMALHIARLKKSAPDAHAGTLRYSTTHRHVRAQYFGDVPGMLPHFHVFCLATAGEDAGSYGFEQQAFVEHVAIYREFFRQAFGSDTAIAVSPRPGYKDSDGFIRRMLAFGESEGIRVTLNEPDWDNRYYLGLRFSITTTIRGTEVPIGDGGFVDWTQKLLGRKKERMLISAIGLDRLLG